jgi:hypothetical protein
MKRSSLIILSILVCVLIISLVFVLVDMDSVPEDSTYISYLYNPIALLENQSAFFLDEKIFIKVNSIHIEENDLVSISGEISKGSLMDEFEIRTNWQEEAENLRFGDYSLRWNVIPTGELGAPGSYLTATFVVSKEVDVYDLVLEMIKRGNKWREGNNDSSIVHCISSYEYKYRECTYGGKLRVDPSDPPSIYGGELRGFNLTNSEIISLCNEMIHFGERAFCLKSVGALEECLTLSSHQSEVQFYSRYDLINPNFTIADICNLEEGEVIWRSY